LSYEILAHYGAVLKHDFSLDLPEFRKYTMEESEPPYGPPKTLDEAIEQREYWRERFYQLMEKYLKVVEGK
jgi:hypothetical protein